MPSVENQVEDDRIAKPEDDLSRYDPLNMHIQTYSEDDEPEVIETIDDEPEDTEYAESEMVFELEDFQDDKVFTTKQVVGLVGLKRDYDLRNLMKVWNAYIKANRDDNGRYIWTKDTVRTLKEMLEVKRSRQLTVEKTLAYYTEPVPTEESTELSQQLTQSGLEAFSNIMVNKFQTALEERTNRLVEYQVQLNARLDADKKQNDENMQQVIAMLKELKTDQQKKDEEIKRLQEENESLRADIEAQKKRKTFFGIPIKG